MQEFPKGQKRQATDAQQHDCDFVQAMLGQHIGYVINVSNRGDEWHEFCARYWMHLNFKNELDGVSWEWMALTALALGQDVLVHCHQGKHRSGVVAMMLMTILAVGGFEDLSLVACATVYVQARMCSHVHSSTSHHAYYEQGKNLIVISL